MSDDKYESDNENEEEIKVNSNFRGLKKPRLCRFCQLPKIGSNQVRPNGLRGCKCPNPSPYYKPSNQAEYIQPIIENLETLQRKDICERDETNIAEDFNSRNNESCNREKYEQTEKASLKKRSFIPPKGMDDGEYPKALFYQYYPNRKKSYTFDVLPLPFLDRLNNEGMISLSMNNKEIQKNWQKFLNDLPTSEFPSLIYPDEKFWRWKTHLRYKPDEIKNDFRYKMNVGPKYDDFGRLPITGEDLKLYRESQVIKLKKNFGVKYDLKKNK